MDKIIRAVKQQLPRFNDYLLKDFRRDQIEQAIDFMGTIFGEAIKLFKGEIKYIGHQVMTAEERVAHELDNKITGGMVNIRDCEWVSVVYKFEYRNHVYTVPIYLPYLHNDFIVINNTKYAVQLAISEKVFTQINNGITAKVVRSPINFWRNRVFQMESVTSGEIAFESIVTVKIHNKSTRRKKNCIHPTVIHYLLCKYGLDRTLELFGMRREDVEIVEHIDKRDIDLYEYYAAQKVSKNRAPLYMKVKKEILKDTKKLRCIASILYLLTYFKKHTVDALYDPDAAIFKIMLGKIIHGEHITDPMAINHIESHMLSLDSYLDPITQARLQEMGISLSNIYDLLIYVFSNIDKMMLDHAHSDLYDKRIDVLDNLLVATIVQKIYHRFYNFEARSSKYNEKIVRSLLRISGQQVRKIYTSAIVRMNPSRYNDNWLISIGIKKVRQNNVKSANNNLIGAPEHRYHPSFAVVESAIAFSASNPGSTGSINPYLEIDEHGFIVRNEEVASQADALLPHLPYK